MEITADRAVHIFNGYLVHRLSQIYASTYRACIGEEEIPPAQCAALFRLSGTASSSQSALAQDLGIDVATMGQVVVRLRRKGLITQNASPDDRRKKLVRITAAGRRQVEALLPGMIATDKQFSAALTAAEMETLRQLMLKIIVFHDRFCHVPFQLPTTSAHGLAAAKDG